MSNPIAVYSGSAVLYWSAIIITLGLLAACNDILHVRQNLRTVVLRY